jgi:hypothetical protein
MGKYRTRTAAFLMFGMGGTIAGIVISLLPLGAPSLGIRFFLGWWAAAAIGGMLFPHGFGNNSSN